MTEPAGIERPARTIHPATAEILKHFDFAHLPEHLQAVSRTFHDLAHGLALTLYGPELTAGLRKLLEAKDCAVRAAVAAHAQTGAIRDSKPGDIPKWTAVTPDGTRITFEPPPDIAETMTTDLLSHLSIAPRPAPATEPTDG